MKSRFNKIAAGLLVIVFVIAGLMAYRLNNINKAIKIYDTCYYEANQAMLLHVAGYTIELYELEGTYFLEGFQFIFPFNLQIKQGEFEAFLELDSVEKIECGYGEKETKDGQDSEWFSQYVE